MLCFRAGVRAFPFAGAALLSLKCKFSPPRVGLWGIRAALSRFSAPLLGRRSLLRLRSLRSGGKSAPIFHLSTICFPQSFPRCGENVHLPVRFSPPFRFSTAGRTDPLPPRGGKVPLRARVYNIGAEKGEKGSVPSVAFRGGRGLLGARDAEWWSRPVVKGLTVGRGSQKGVGECVGAGLPGAPVGVGRVKVVGRARSVCTRVATAGGEQGCHGRCACTIRAQF